MKINNTCTETLSPSSFCRWTEDGSYFEIYGQYDMKDDGVLGNIAKLLPTIGNEKCNNTVISFDTLEINSSSIKIFKYSGKYSKGIKPNTLVQPISYQFEFPEEWFRGINTYHQRTTNFKGAILRYLRFVITDEELDKLVKGDKVLMTSILSDFMPRFIKNDGILSFETAKQVFRRVIGRNSPSWKRKSKGGRL